MKMRIFFLLTFLLSLPLHGTDELYSVEVRKAPIKDIVRMLAQMDGKNVVIPDNITGEVTASFQSVLLPDALQAILETNNLGAVTKNNVVQIATRETLEKLGEDLVTQTYPLKYAKAPLISAQIQSLLSTRGVVMTDERTNSVTVRDTSVHLQDVETLLANIDKLDKQVLIEAKVVEASADFIRSLGIQWGVTKSGGSVGITGLEKVGAADSTRTLSLDTPATGLSGASPLSGIALALGSFGGVITDVQLTAAEERGDLNILSRPSIVTLNNQPATIRSGVKFFVKTSGDVVIGSGSSNLQQIDAGITMTVTPQVTRDAKVSLMIDVTESQPDFSRQVDGIPAIIDNNASTNVFLSDGETTVIGGLFQLQKTHAQKGIPGLMRIPLFGSLFRSNTRGKSKKELLIFIKPTIVKGSAVQLSSTSAEEEAEFFKTKKEKKGKSKRKR